MKPELGAFYYTAEVPSSNGDIDLVFLNNIEKFIYGCHSSFGGV